MKNTKLAMLETLLNSFSYPVLFLISFLSSTLIPLASEAFVLGFLKLDFNVYLVLLVATFGNTLGSLTSYFLAYFGKKEVLERYFSKALKKLDKINSNFAKFGCFYAFFCFLPLVGDLFALGLGFARFSLIKTIIFISLGKLSRYIFIAFLSQQL